VIGEKEIERFGELQVPTHTDRLAAFPLSSGHALGSVRIVASPEAAGELGAGYILVCRSTDPSWTPLFVNAGGIVLECGGALSHGAVVARELGKPAVVLANATQLLKEGQRVAVDGTQGAVMLTDVPPPPHWQDASATVDPNDMRIAWNRVPPVPGRRERLSTRRRNISFLFWAIFLALAFLVPQLRLYEGSMAVLDALFWPLVRGFGGPITVAVIAASLAVLSMVGQWLLCDTPRLREAKRRAASLWQDALSLPPGSPRDRAIAALASPVQMRLTLASFVPIAVLLGPMVMSFLWLPERIDPAVRNPRPGATAIVSAIVDGDYTGPVTLTIETPHETAVQTQTATPIRPVLLSLAEQLQRGEVPLALQSLNKSSEFLEADLQRFLRSSLPPQTISLTYTLPSDVAAIYPVSVSTGAQTLSAELVLGDVAPPPVAQTDERGNRFQQVEATTSGPILSLRIRYADARRAENQVFCTVCAVGLAL
ncbi:MAG: PEP-utilizing enzyme, partial [Phycisphaerales bacterium]|nr:PEP-utilizing enzyme [Phycisphaerales bacterium]